MQKRQQQEEEEANEQQKAEQGAAVEGEGQEEEERVVDDYPFLTTGEEEGQRVTTHDRAVLMILFEMWKGPAWNGNANWGSDAPLKWWYNVSVRCPYSFLRSTPSYSRGSSIGRVTYGGWPRYQAGESSGADGRVKLSFGLNRAKRYSLYLLHTCPKIAH